MQTTLDSILDIRLYQPKEGYRFSLDAVLLYSFVNLKKAENIADLGAGSGVVGLLLARKYPEAKVTLMELQESLYKLAVKNIGLNGLRDRVGAIKSDIRDIDLEPGGFDLVVSNPPFRKPRTGLLSVDDERAVARHEIEMKLPELLRAASRLLKNRGRFVFIHHPLRLAELMRGLREAGLEPKRLRFVHGKRSSEAKMVLVEAVRHGREGLKVESPLFVYNDDGTYTEELMAIYGP
jgi:tRNA1Val (adenine37-N6)-methyltransferase